MLKPGRADYCAFDPSSKPWLLVVVDTEEEFDWTGEFSRGNTGVQAISAIGKAQAIFDEYGITPVYATSYPVISQEPGYRPIQEIHSTGRCVIAAHLHPWVTPPFDEPLSRQTCYPGNLPKALETSKLQVLIESIENRFGVVPAVYKAGRYGLGANTAVILEDLGFEVDLSVCPHMDYSGEGGPNFRFSSPWPYWFGRQKRLLELPVTVGFSGLLRRWGAWLHHAATGVPFKWGHAVGVLSRLGMLNRIWLTPEGYLTSDHRQLVRALYRDGLRVFSFSFHSPSLLPGHTPYVRTSSDLEAFLSCCRQFFEFFIADLGGIPVTPLALKAKLNGSSG